jgi:hypothetical protein
MAASLFGQPNLAELASGLGDKEEFIGHATSEL